MEGRGVAAFSRSVIELTLNGFPEQQGAGEARSIRFMAWRSVNHILATKATLRHRLAITTLPSGGCLDSVYPYVARFTPLGQGAENSSRALRGNDWMREYPELYILIARIKSNPMHERLYRCCCACR